MVFDIWQAATKKASDKQLRQLNLTLIHGENQRTYRTKRKEEF